jgi:hypothetical protein
MDWNRIVDGAIYILGGHSLQYGVAIADPDGVKVSNVLCTITPQNKKPPIFIEGFCEIGREALI